MLFKYSKLIPISTYIQTLCWGNDNVPSFVASMEIQLNKTAFRLGNCWGLVDKASLQTEPKKLEQSSRGIRSRLNAKNAIFWVAWIFRIQICLYDHYWVFPATGQLPVTKKKTKQYWCLENFTQSFPPCVNSHQGTSSTNKNASGNLFPNNIFY